jgi:hypothetical protein
MNAITKINLSKLKHCEQVWNKMPKNDKGRLCQQCNHTIIDFRRTSDAEIAKAHVFSQEKVCGIYTERQLKLSFEKQDRELPDRWKSFYMAMFSLLSLTSFREPIVSEITTIQTESEFEYENQMKPRSKVVCHPAIRDSLIVSGRIMDDNGTPIPFANVVVMGIKTGASSDFDGVYHIDLSEFLDSTETIQLKYYGIGYHPVFVDLHLDDLKKKHSWLGDIMFEHNEVTAFSVTVKYPWYKRIGKRIDRLFRK